MSAVVASIGTEDYSVVLNVKEKFISLYVKPVFSSVMDGAYIYTIKGYSSVLSNGENYELVKSVSYQLNKKYDMPVYLNVNGYPSQFSLLKTLIELIDNVKE
ncbi:uncharacterized protein KQ657_000369 [Scheffersomyces spartinae]|uniref:Uncharacterized protein n=1 Tax=Scheffersomyces spartinae TaxID=45513 RepID=A0A9P7V9G6_9ASCO|nr:uncharacterized protein KQ657_000369 [Scheffersomyces spartinae]KAG7193682.1 hypothetical protein KQ657_000369 [Scheffersomyces spartinae]